VRTAQLRAHVRDRFGTDWWRAPATGDFLRELFAEGTRPSSEEIAERIHFPALDTGPLVGELVSAA
jgi:hypothetical protein